MAALCKEAVEESSKASMVPGANLSPEQAGPSRAGRRQRKKKRSLNAGEVGSAAKAGPYVHPDPPLKKRKTVVTGDDGDGDDTCDVMGNDISGIAIVDRDGPEVAKIRSKPHNTADEVRVVREYGVADKKGQRHQIDRPRTVSTRFGQSSVDAYLDLLTSVLSRKMEDLVSPPTESSSRADLKANGMRDKCPEGVPNVAAAREEVVGVISYTEELSKNVVRTGVPPPLPKFTRVAMWRGEDVCLNQLGAGEVQELLVGIHWCEPQGSNAQIDLDLSVMVSCADAPELFVGLLSIPS